MNTEYFVFELQANTLLEYLQLTTQYSRHQMGIDVRLQSYCS